ncbi:MAG: radical SAM protein [Bacteroidales bacterium]
MSTALFHALIVGPIHSRRLGKSLGINLLPTHSKWCNFNCVYCECGWNEANPFRHEALCTPEQVQQALELKLQQLHEAQDLPDAITFSGNGEPTMHPQFSSMVDIALALRNKYAPLARVCVLSNATLLYKKEVVEALQKVDLAILKLDAALESTVQAINLPQGKFSLAQSLENMRQLGEKLIVQTLFLRGEVEGKSVDNTTDEELSAWLKVIAQLRPKEVMLYSIERDTPAKNLQQVNKADLVQIAQRVKQLGITASVYANH